MLSLYDGIAIDFNPRSHKGNDGKTIEPLQAAYIFQSTFPQGERLCRPFLADSRIIISIHVPTRGTTRLLQRQCKLRQFQSTFPQGERHFPGTIISSLCRFQSTFPQGERQKVNYYPVTITAISIHVPTRGTTLYSMMSLWILLFQSTFPQGERRREPGGGD